MWGGVAVVGELAFLCPAGESGKDSPPPTPGSARREGVVDALGHIVTKQHRIVGGGIYKVAFMYVWSRAWQPVCMCVRVRIDSVTCDKGPLM